MKLTMFAALYCAAFQKDTGGSFGSADTMTQTEFQKAAGVTLDTIEKKNAELLGNVGNLQAETKKALEDLTQIKNKHAEDFASLSRAFENVKLHLANERRMAYGDPVARIAQDPEKRTLFVAMIAKSLDLTERCGKRVREVAKGLRIADGLAVRDMDTTQTPGSGFVGTNEIERDVYDVLAQYGAFRTVDFRTVSAKAVEIPVKSARAAMTFVDEAAAISADSTKAGSRVTLTPKKIAGLISVSSELLEDDVIGAVQDVLNDFAESAAYRLDHITFAADGTSDATHGGFTGMFRAGTAVTAVSGNVSVATLDFEDVVNVIANAPAGILSRMCKWWIHPTILVKMLKIKDSNGRPIFNTAIEAPSAGAIGSILGYPVISVPAAPSTDSTSSYLAAFGDPFAMAVRVRRNLQFDRSEHFSFDTDEITFRATMRGGAKIKAATGIQVLKTAAS